MTEKFAMLEIKLYMATGSLYKNYKLIVNFKHSAYFNTQCLKHIE